MKSLRVQHSIDSSAESIDIPDQTQNSEEDPLLESIEQVLPSPENQLASQQRLLRRRSKNIKRVKGCCKFLLISLGCLFILIMMAMSVFLGLLYSGSLPATEYHIGLPSSDTGNGDSRVPKSDSGDKSPASSSESPILKKLMGTNMTDFRMSQLHETGFALQFNFSFPSIEQYNKDQKVKGIDSIIRWVTTNMTLKEFNWTLASDAEQVTELQLSEPIRDFSVYDMTELQNITFDILNFNGGLLGQHISRHFSINRTTDDIMPLTIASVSNILQILNGILIPLPPIKISTQINITDFLTESSIKNIHVAEFDILKRTALLAFDLDYSTNIWIDSTLAESEWRLFLECLVEHRNGAKINLAIETQSVRLIGHKGEVLIKISPLQKSQDTLIIQARGLQKAKSTDDGPSAWSWLEILKMLATEKGRQVLIEGSVITLDNFRFDTGPHTIKWMNDFANEMHLKVNMSMYQ